MLTAMGSIYMHKYIHIYMMAVYSLDEHDHGLLWFVIVGHETGSDF